MKYSVIKNPKFIRPLLLLETKLQKLTRNTTYNVAKAEYTFYYPTLRHTLTFNLSAFVTFHFIRLALDTVFLWNI
jgi:hypothetical protein